MSDARKVSDRLTDTVIKEDLEAVTNSYGQDTVLIASGGIYKGREQIAEFFQTWFDPFSELSVEGEDQGDVGQPGPRRVVLELHQHRAARADSETVPAPGKQVTVRAADICAVEGNLAVEHHIYHNQVEMLRQLGLLPE
jgi:ketosteroid isomerase-like protein